MISYKYYLCKTQENSRTTFSLLKVPSKISALLHWLVLQNSNVITYKSAIIKCLEFDETVYQI